MHIEVCPKKAAAYLFARESIGLNKSTWNKCMNQTACKIGVIVAIVVVALLVFWVVATLIRCCCLGLSCVEALCCCCCRRPHNNRYVEPQQHYNNPNMYPQVQPMRQAEPSYQPVNNPVHYGRRSSYDGYKLLHF